MDSNPYKAPQPADHLRAAKRKSSHRKPWPVWFIAPLLLMAITALVMLLFT
ncbi:MAG: hypothetical protein RIK87_22060 [Fuerstiella sp.]